MIEWTKPNGNTLTTNDNDATVAYCEGLGWSRDGATPQSLPDDGITAEDVNKMRTAGLKKLAKAQGIALDESLNVTDMRCVVVNALFEKE